MTKTAIREANIDERIPEMSVDEALGAGLWPWVRPRRSRRAQVLIGVCGVLVLALLGGGLFFVTQRNKITKVSYTDALRRYHQQVATSGSSPTPDGPGAAAAVPGLAVPSAAPPGPGTGSAAAVRAGADAARSATDPNGAVGAPSAAPSSSGPTAASVAAPFALPAQGVYAYRTTGGESISVGASHSYPAQTFATVHTTGGCQWVLENDVIKEHVDHRTVCSQPGQLLEVAQQRTVTFYGVSDGATYTCHPSLPQALTTDQPGATHDGVCSDGKGSSAAIHAALVGRERITVGGTPIDSVHVVLDSVLTGRAQGKAHDDLWFTPDTGMVAVWNRFVDTNANAAFGANVHYQEKATFALESLLPGN